MENKILTKAECDYLRGKNINPDMPLFPLSCATAYLVKKNSDRLCEINRTARKEFVTEEYMRTSLENEYRVSASTNLVGLRRLIACVVSFYVTFALYTPIYILLSDIMSDFFSVLFTLLIMMAVLLVVFSIAFSKLIKIAMVKININMHKKTIDEQVLALRERVKAHALQVEKEKTEIPVLKQDISKLQDCLNKMSDYRECIPCEYWDDAYDFYEICFKRRVDTITEAIRSFEEIQYQRRMEEQQRRQTRLMQEANQAAYEANQTAKKAEEIASNAALDAMFAVINSNR